MNLEWLTKDKAIKQAEAEVRSATRRADFWRNNALKKEKARTKEKKIRMCEVCHAKLGKTLKSGEIHAKLDAKFTVCERKNKKKLPARDRNGRFK
jgi:hypothetical protein